MSIRYFRDFQREIEEVKKEILEKIRSIQISGAPSVSAQSVSLFDYFIEIRYDSANNTYIVTIADFSQGKVDQYTSSSPADASYIINSFIASVSNKRIYIRDNSNTFISISLNTDNFYVVENVFHLLINSVCDAIAYNVSSVTIISSARVIKVVNSINVFISNAQKITLLFIDAFNVSINNSYVDTVKIRSEYLNIINSTLAEAYIYSYYISIDNLTIERDASIFSDTIVYVSSITSRGGAGSISGKMRGTITIPANSSSQIKLFNTNLFISVNIIYSVRESALIGKVSASYDQANKIVTFKNTDTSNQATVDYLIIIS
jgi:hypothetical protein